MILKQKKKNEIDIYTALKEVKTIGVNYTNEKSELISSYQLKL